MEGGREQNYWPGFVDALSNVVLTLVFVLVIFVFALVLASNKVEQKMKEVSQTQNASKTGQASLQEENDELKKQLAAMTTELEKARGDARASSQQKTGAIEQKQALTDQNQNQEIVVGEKKDDKKNVGPVEVDQSANSIILGFPLSVAEIDEKSAEKVGHVLATLQKNSGKHKIIMKSYVGKETYSAAVRLAYYRAISARNNLITKLGESPDDITISIVNPPKPEDGRVEIIFQKE